jgi:hypothetical protein
MVKLWAITRSGRRLRFLKASSSTAELFLEIGLTLFQKSLASFHSVRAPSGLDAQLAL